MRVRASVYVGIALCGLALAASGCGGDDTGEVGPDADEHGNGNGNGEAIDRASYTSSIQIPIEDGAPTCCRDFGDISEDPGEIDNAYAEITQTLQTFGFDFQETITEQVEGGDLVFLLRHLELGSEDEVFDIVGLQGAFAEGTTFADAEDGDGQFEVLDISYDDDGEPQVLIEDAELSGGELTTPAQDISFAAPVGDAQLVLTLRETQLGGQATLTDESIEYDGGELSGYLLLEDLFGELNAILSGDACECLGLDGEDVFVREGGDWEAQCVPEGDHQCGEDSVCATLGADDGFCDLLPGALAGNADLDTSEDGSEDALSIGFEWTGAPAEIVD